MPPPIRLGVAGTSWWADLMHLPSLTSHPGAAVVAVCGRDPGRAEALAAKYGVARAYTSYEAMLDQAGLDAVVVATPDDLHAPMALAALERGLHVLCEKPLARSAAEARLMYEAAERAGVVHMVFFTYRWTPAYRFVRDLVADGRLGRPLSFALSFSNGYGLRPGYAWRFDARRASGVAGDLGSHMIDLARWILGDEVARASASLRTHAPHDPPNDVPDGGAAAADPRVANDSAVLALEMAGGAHGTVYCTSVARLGDQGSAKQLTVRGDRGTLEASITLAGADLRLLGDDGAPAAPLEVPAAYGSGDSIALFRQQPIGGRLFVEAILGGTRPAPTFYDGWRVQQVIDGALRADASGRWEAL